MTLRVPIELLRCPRSGGALSVDGAELVAADGAARYPLVHGIPILIDEERSLFTLAELVASPPPAGRSARQVLRARLTGNAVSRRNLAQLADLLEERHRRTGARQRVLVVGGGILGFGMDALTGRAGIDLVETDVYVGPRTQVVCDAHDLPFAAGAFDAVVAQAVLEHVLDPPRVVAELYRVLLDGGLVYSEIPFMQQVHEGAFDFTRYTRTGHRRLFRCFDELESGAVSGAAEALAWSIRYFVVALAGDARRVRRIAALAARVATLWLSAFDRLLLERPATLDAASGTFFIGRRRDTPVPDAQVIAGHRGVNGTPDR
jgi:SAM-dependent methyltransferase